MGRKLKKRNCVKTLRVGEAGFLCLKISKIPGERSLLPPWVMINRNLQRKTRPFGEEPGDPSYCLRCPLYQAARGLIRVVIMTPLLGHRGQYGLPSSSKFGEDCHLSNSRGVTCSADAMGPQLG